MKKICVFLLLITSVFSLFGCTSAAEAEPSAIPEEYTSITIPAHVLELTEIDLAAMAATAGISGIEKQEDGSLLYRLTTRQKELLLTQMREFLDSYITDLKTSWSFISFTTLSPELDLVSIYAKKDGYDPVNDPKIAPSLYAPIVLYRAFSGLDTPVDFALKIRVIDVDSEETIADLVYPEPEPEPSPSSAPTEAANQ